MNYTFSTNQLSREVKWCLDYCKSLGFESLDEFQDETSFAFQSKGGAFGGRQIHIDFLPLKDQLYIAKIEARNVGLELKKHPKNKKLEIEMIRAFHKYVISRRVSLKLAKSA